MLAFPDIQEKVQQEIDKTVGKIKFNQQKITVYDVTVRNTIMLSGRQNRLTFHLASNVRTYK